MRICHFPINAVARNTVGVVAVGGRGIDKLADHGGCKAREGDGQRLPVLKDVAPVALVIQDALAAGIPCGDGKAVPGPARITVAAAEGEREIFPANALELPVPGFCRPQTWHGIRAWGEAGTAIGYLKGHMLPDYRGGVSVTRGLHREDSGWLADATLDALYVSRFDHDFLAYTQTRAGYDFGQKIVIETAH